MTSQIAIALAMAVVAGILLQGYADFVNEYIKPLGSIFLSLLKFIVVPLVLFLIMAGILSMNDVSKVGRLGLQEEWPCRAMYLDSACEKMIRRTVPVTHAAK